MSAELEKAYDPAVVEAQTYRLWLEEKCFEADPAKPGEPYSIVIPPPNVTGALHLGHAINNTLQDILIRVHRMRGFNTVWIPGIDHAGIATQAVVERQLKENENKTRHDVGRECLVKRIWAWKQQYGDRIYDQLKRLGCSCDWSRAHFTLDEQCARAVRETFFKLFRDGLVYRGKRLVNWDTHLLTSISDDELYDEAVKTSMWSIKYKIVAPPQREPSGSAAGMSAAGVSAGAETRSESREKPAAEPLDSLSARVTHMTVATTRPETMLADTAVTVHSQDPRWNWAIGMSVELPLTGRKIPIIADDILVDPAFGSGVVKVTPAHDPNDYAVYTRHLGKPSEIAILNLMTPDGKVNDADASWAKYAGLTFAQARKKIIEDLTAGGFHNPETDVKPHEANVKFSDRSKTAIQPYLSDQWFVKMAPLAEPALEVVRDGTIKFFPERHAQQYLSWLGEKRDWPISRQLWWGHRIPVWTKRITITPESCVSLFAQGDLEFLDGGDPVCDWMSGDAPMDGKPVASVVFRHVESGQTHRFVSGAHGRACMPWIEDSYSGEFDVFVCVADAPKMEERLRSHGFTQDPDVLDTWFSSALWPHGTLGWPQATADLARWYPTSVLMTGRDIITLWVARMVMMGMYNMSSPQRDTGFQPVPGAVGTGKSLLSKQQSNTHGPEARATMKRLGVPFAQVSINPTILDGKGERMSKSKGNGVDPVDIIDTHGADALRFTLTTMATETQDVRMPVKKDSQGRNTSDKFDLGRNFCTKLWNAARFVMTNLDSQSREPSGSAAGMMSAQPAAEPLGSRSVTDRWIVSRFNRAVEDSNAALMSYRFDQYARACYDFFWRDFCDWYLEAAKPAMKDPARSAQTANILAAMLDGALRLMHPMIPFITEKIWQSLHPGTLLISAAWPEAGPIDQDAEHVFTRLQAVITAIRNVRNEYKVSPRQVTPVQLSVPGDAAEKVTTDNREMIELLGCCTIDTIGTNLPAPVNAARGGGEGFEVYLLNLIDPQAEQQRNAKSKESVKQKMSALQSRLANPNYADKAPAHLVQQTRDELAALEAELKKLEG